MGNHAGKPIKMSNTYSTIILALLTITCCSPATTSQSEIDKKQVLDSVRHTLANYYVAIKKEGLTAEFRFLDSSADFFWVPPNYATAILYDSVANIINQNARAFKTVDNTWDTLRINYLTPELASYTGRLRSITTDTSGRVFTFTMVETGLVIKRKDGWKLLSGQTSMVNP